MPGVSIVLNTFSDLHPINSTGKDIFTFFFEKLSDQSYKDIEVVIVDRMYNERKDNINFDKFDMKIKYVPPKPSPWHSMRKAPSIANDRNSGILLSSSDYIICFDDCIAPISIDFIAILANSWKRKQVVVRPNIDQYMYDNEKLKLVSRDPIHRWTENKIIELANSKENLITMFEISGTRGGCFALPAEVFMILNGFDERFDGAWGSEDCQFYRRLDAFSNITGKYKRYIYSSKSKQARAMYLYHKKSTKYSNSKEPLYVCNEAYAQWTYKVIDEIEKANNPEKALELMANSKILDAQDLESIRLICNTSCPSGMRRPCCRTEPPGIEYYTKFQSIYSMSYKRKEMTSKFGDRYGTFNPWTEP